MSKPSRRKYSSLMRFFAETMNNTRINHRTRFAAALRIADILTDHDRSVEREKIAIERAQARAGEAALLESQLNVLDKGGTPPATESEEDTKLRLMFSNLSNPTGGDNEIYSPARLRKRL